MVTESPICEAIEPGSNAEAIKTHDQVTYCPAWGAWLCANCRVNRNNAELKVQSPLPKPETQLPLLQL
jgi:hypothetical protein